MRAGRASSNEGQSAGEGPPADPARWGQVMAQKKAFALLAFDGDELLEDLKAQLKDLMIETGRARTCEEVARLLEQTHPELIFTGTKLSDGTWKDVLSLTEKAYVPINVIVVGMCKDTSLYLSTIDYGAFDFILPPFERDALGHVVRVASENVRCRREQQAIRAVA
jgi:DNA-binding NtrC family response regulator